MGFVLADSHGWLSLDSTSAPFTAIPLQTFAALRNAVTVGTADFFMWEYFTSKRYYDNGEIKKIGEIYTPWPSWHIVARSELVSSSQLRDLLQKLDLGIEYFREHQGEAVEYISADLDYSKEDV